MIQNWQQRWQTALQQQHGIIFDYNRKTIKDQYAQYVKCPVCANDGGHTVLMFEKDMFKYYRCKKCSLVFMNPRLNNVATSAFYNSNVNEIYNEIKFDAVTESTMRDNCINVENLKILELVKNSQNKGDLLEIGCAKGYFLKHAKDAGYKVWGIELNKKNCAVAKEMLGDTILDIDLNSVHFNNGMFDVVYMRDVIEHLPDPTNLFLELNRIMKPNAILFIDTHNIDGLINSIVREKHVVVFGFEHPTHWSPSSLKALFSKTGFECKTVKFKSQDCTLYDIFSYFITPTFTTILSKKQNGVVQFVLKLLRKPFALPPISAIDKTVTPLIPQILKRGSTMKVFGVKLNK